MFTLHAINQETNKLPIKVDIPDYIRHEWYNHQISIARKQWCPDWNVDDAWACESMSVDHLKAIVDFISHK